MQMVNATGAPRPVSDGFGLAPLSQVCVIVTCQPCLIHPILSHPIPDPRAPSLSLFQTFERKKKGGGVFFFFFVHVMYIVLCYIPRDFAAHFCCSVCVKSLGVPPTLRRQAYVVPGKVGIRKDLGLGRARYKSWKVAAPARPLYPIRPPSPPTSWL